MSVHPHGCGERQPVIIQEGRLVGSSPRLWGTLANRSQNPRKSRFIPTAVGNAWGFKSHSPKKPVHPHGCGERQPTLTRSLAIAGSSPRLWGTHLNAGIVRTILRFIPTAVGNAEADQRPDTCQAVHPHGCGERRRSGNRHNHSGGSSPRLWGTQNTARCCRQR